MTPHEDIERRKESVSRTEIFIRKGVYQENDIEVNKSLIIFGEDGTILDGGNKGSILHISSSDFELKNYTELLNDVINNNTLLAQNKHITIVKSFSEDPILTNIDSDKISLALNHILHNAIRFSEPNSNITIVATTNNTAITTQIIDEGIGISKNNIKNVFT